MAHSQNGYSRLFPGELVFGKVDFVKGRKPSRFTLPFHIIYGTEKYIKTYAPIGSKLQHPPGRSPTPCTFELLKIGLFKFPHFGVKNPFLKTPYYIA